MFVVVLRRVLFLSILVLSSSCTGLVEHTSAADGEFHRHLQKWRLAAINDYDIHYQKGCYCLADHQRPVQVKIRSGQIVEAVYIDDQQVVSLSSKNDLKSVSDLFDLIDEAMAKPAAELAVSYDQSLGYPTSIYIDYYARMADDEITVKDIRVMKINNP